MLRFLVLFISLSFPLLISAQWTWQNPLPQGNWLECVSFADENNGYAAGNSGTLLKTTDAGLNWTNFI
ncbi:MAG: hypothetical protein IPH45_10910 [Bacteroidales bacterium]|nr:hypothetical protein [Bacteroidales bacterium]